MIETEGGLYGAYNSVSYYGDDTFGGTYQEYEITPRGLVMGKLGIHWEKKYTEGYWSRLFRDVLFGGPIFGMFGSLPALVISRSVAEAVSNTLSTLIR